MPDYFTIKASNGLINDSNDPVWWNGASHQVDGGMTVTPNLDHAIMWSGQKKRIKFTVKDTSNDHGPADTDPTRRSELDPKQPLAADTEFWGAVQVKLPGLTGDWSSAGGIAFMQIHAGDAGGSPTFAIRSNKNGRLWITRNNSSGGNVDILGSQTSTGGTQIDDGLIHDFVFRFTINATNGALKIWMDQSVIVDISGVTIGHGDGTAYMKFGMYCSGGIGAEQSIEHANVVRPSTTSLSSRTTSAPTWPTDVLDTTGAPTVSARQTSDSGASNATSWVPTLAAHATGDYLFIVVSTDDIDTPTNTSTSGWTRLIQTSHASGGTVHGAIFYYGSAGVMTAAPSSSVTPPTLTMSTEQATAIAFTVQAASAPNIAAAGATNSGTNAKPPELDLGSEKVALWIAALHIDAQPVVTSGPPAYINFTTKQAQTTTSAGTYTAEWTGKMQAEKPSPFDTATEQWVCHTIALSSSGSGVSAPVGRANETDTAFAMGPSVKRVTETDTAFARTAGIIRAVGMATTTNTALALSKVQIRAVGLATEADTSLALTLGGAQPNASIETDTALARTHIQIGYKQAIRRVNSIQGFGTASAGGAATISLAGLTLLQNDLLVCLISTGNSVANLSITATGNNTGSSFVSLDAYSDGTFDTNAGAFFFYQGATVDTSISVAGLSPSEEYAYIFLQYRGVHSVNKFGSTFATATGIASDRADPPSVTMDTKNAKVVVTYYAAQANLRAWSQPRIGANFLQQADNTNTRLAVTDYDWFSGLINPGPVFNGDGAGALDDSWVSTTFSLNATYDELDTPYPRGLSLGVTFAGESDIALALHQLGVSAAEETDIAFPLTRFPAAQTANESDSAFALAQKQILLVELAEELDEPVGRGFQLGVSTALETDTAIQPASLQSVSTGLAAEVDEAILRPAVGALLPGIGIEINLARSLGYASTHGLAAETDLGFARTTLQLQAVGRAEEIDTAFEFFGAIFAGHGAKPKVDHRPNHRRRIQPVHRIP